MIIVIMVTFHNLLIVDSVCSLHNCIHVYTDLGLASIKFYVDDAFDCRHTQSDVFDRLVRPLVGDFFAGFHCVIFSYGQTGSGLPNMSTEQIARAITQVFFLLGKTHTLIGGSSTEIAVPESEKGILPRAAELIFQRKKALLERNESGGTSCTVRLSVLEIYQERLKDLLLLGGGGQKQADAPLLRLREQSDGAVWVEGLTEVVLAEEQDFNRWVTAAMKKRVVGAHNMNSVSSRSHLCIVVSLSILQREGATAEGAGTAADRAGEKRISSKLHLVDLAGSEMVRSIYCDAVYDLISTYDDFCCELKNKFIDVYDCFENRIFST